MKNKFLLLFSIMLFCLFGSLFSQDITVKYNKTVQSGDAVVITLSLDEDAPADFTAWATLHLVGSSDKLVKTNFYQVAPHGFSTIIPISAWYDQNDFYICVHCNFSNGKYKEIDLPLNFIEKEFNEDFIWLDKKNTTIKTDSSPSRQSQIDSFWQILDTISNDSLYHATTFSYPLETIYNTGYFGDKRTYKYNGTNETGSTSMHYGADYRAAIGTDVFACGTGKVVMAQDRISSGLSIMIEHLPGFYSLYYHLSEMDVTVGQIVEQGEFIGKSGDTGLATGPHLHWEVRILGVPVDPELFLTQPLILRN